MGKIGDGMRQKLFGQDEAIRLIEEQIEITQAGLGDESRPPAVFCLYGPTGSGKTHTIETLAEVVHKNHRKYQRIDCAEFQLDHEIAKILGAPPGYLGHRETSPLITQGKLNILKTEAFPFSFLLFDEIEKASISMHRLMLGILDKGRLRTNDGMAVDFTSTFIFMTSNLGLEDPQGEAAPQAESSIIGSLLPDVKAAPVVTPIDQIRERFKKKFTPEFINRLDCFIPFAPLGAPELDRILSIELDAMQARIVNSLGGATADGQPCAFVLDMTPTARQHIVDASNTKLWGAREIRRMLQRKVTCVVARMMVACHHPPGGKVTVDFKNGEIVLVKGTANTAELLQAAITTEKWRKQKDAKEHDTD